MSWTVWGIANSLCLRFTQGMKKVSRVHISFLLVNLAIVAVAAIAFRPQLSTAASGPNVKRSDIKLRKVAEVGGGFVRMDYDKARGQLLYLNAKGDIYKADPATGKTGLLYEGATATGDRDCVTTSIAIGPDGSIYLTCNLKTDAKNVGSIRRGALEGGKWVWSTIARTEPYPIGKTQFDHDFNGLVVSPDGKFLLVNSGSRTDHGEVEDAGGANKGLREVPLTSSVFRISISFNSKDKEIIVLPNDLDKLQAKRLLYTRGTRNCYDLAFAANGDLFCGDNSPDGDYPDEINWLRPGRHYGFPWRLGNEDNPTRTSSYDPARDKHLQNGFFAVENKLYKADTSFPSVPEGVKFTDPILNYGPDADNYRKADGSEGNASKESKPLAGITPHRSPLGLSFDTANALSGDYKGALFVASWGAAGGTLSDKGSDLTLVKLTKQRDNYAATMTQIIADLNQPIDTVLVGKKLYVLEFGGDGAIWEVGFP